MAKDRTSIRGRRLPDRPGRAFKPFTQSVLYLSSFAWAALDLLFGLAAFLFAQWATPHRGSLGASAYDPLLTGLCFGALVALLRHVLDTHDFTQLVSLTRILSTSLAASLGAVVLLSLGLNWVLYIKLGRFVMAYAFLASVGLSVLSRLATRGWIAAERHRVLFIGRPQAFRRLKAQLEGPHRRFFAPPAYLAPPSGSKASRTALLSALQAHPHEVVVEDGTRAEALAMEYGLEITKGGCLVRPLSRFHAELNREEDLDALTPGRWLASSGLGTGAYTGHAVKRAGDIAFSLLGLLLSLFPGLLVALLVKLTSPGPVFYRQTRVGQHGRDFPILKFRTMRLDAEKGGAVWAKEKDSRVTPVGGFLRRTRLDELPQFLNILKGDMSFVGPRPERPEFVAQLERSLPAYHLRHLVKPGLTGWAQIKFRYGSGLEDARRKLAFDLYYVGHSSLLFDLSIVLKTLAAMAKGAR